jgi:hypothetical protein
MVRLDRRHPLKVVSDDGEHLLVVADFEDAAVGDTHHDCRYLVSMGHDLGPVPMSSDEFRCRSRSDWRHPNEEQRCPSRPPTLSTCPARL